MSWNQEEETNKGAFKRKVRGARPASNGEENSRLTSNTMPDAVIHCVIEAVEAASYSMLEDNGIDDIALEETTPKELFQKWLDEDKIELVIAAAAITVLDDIHGATHEAMRGLGIKDLSNPELKDAVMTWYNSAEFDKKYKSTDHSALVTILGAE